MRSYNAELSVGLVPLECVVLRKFWSSLAHFVAHGKLTSLVIDTAAAAEEFVAEHSVFRLLLDASCEGVHVFVPEAVGAVTGVALHVDRITAVSKRGVADAAAQQRVGVLIAASRVSTPSGLVLASFAEVSVDASQNFETKAIHVAVVVGATAGTVSPDALGQVRAHAVCAGSRDLILTCLRRHNFSFYFILFYFQGILFVCLCFNSRGWIQMALISL